MIPFKDVQNWQTESRLITDRDWEVGEMEGTVNEYIALTFWGDKNISN